MRTICITLTDPRYGEFGPRQDRAKTLRESVGLHADPFYGIHAARAGLVSTKLYMFDGPPGATLTSKSVGTWISHRALWAACLLLKDEEFLLLEDDAFFPSDWAARLSTVSRDVPSDWDIVNIGACCAMDKPRMLVAGSVYIVDGGPMCLHAYLVKRRALRVLIETQDEAGCAAPVDISTVLHSYARLNCYTILPRIVEQLDFDTLAP